MGAIEVQNASSDDVPSTETIQSWVAAALLPENKEAEACIRIVDESESQHLNHTYRHKSSPTNVLSFPSDIPDEVEMQFLGDLAVCASIVKREAKEQSKTLDAHWAHMIIHGVLHLQGYDHIDDDDAEVMESLETKILGKLNFPPPYDMIIDDNQSQSNLTGEKQS